MTDNNLSYIIFSDGMKKMNFLEGIGNLAGKVTGVALNTKDKANKAIENANRKIDRYNRTKDLRAYVAAVNKQIAKDAVKGGFAKGIDSVRSKRG